MLAKGEKKNQSWLTVSSEQQPHLRHVKVRYIYFKVVVDFMSCQQWGEPVRVQQAAHKAGFHVTLYMCDVCYQKFGWPVCTTKPIFVVLQIGLKSQSGWFVYCWLICALILVEQTLYSYAYCSYKTCEHCPEGFQGLLVLSIRYQDTFLCYYRALTCLIAKVSVDR